MAEREPKRVVVTGVGAITAQGPTADALWEGVVGGRVAIRNVESLPMDGYRTKLGGEVKERIAPEREYRHPDDYREPVIDFALKASEEAVGAVRRLRLGRDRRPSAGASSSAPATPACSAGEEWYRRRLQGKEAPSELLLLVPPQAVAESLASAFGFKGPVLSREHRLRGLGQRDRLRVRADPPGPRGRRPRGRRRIDLRGPVLRLQRARVAVAQARRAVLARPRGPVARRGRRDDRADARGPRAGARRADQGRAAGLLAVGRRLPPDGPAAGRRGRRAGDQAGAGLRGRRRRRGRLRQLPRHRHGQERPGGDRRDQVRRSASTPTRPRSPRPSR